ncbi:MAG: PQQ-binding-like beta-propeller repeat protein [Bacteroidales bacterium]|nr:PQQ-binding-like beta-propeller repeat protein [Bacteroidales bacterium]
MTGTKTYRTAAAAILMAAVMLLAACKGEGGSAAGSAAGDWTVFRGDGSLAGSTRRALPAEPRLLWSTTTGQRTVASPLVKDGTIYTVGRRGLLRAVDADGQEVFSKDFSTFIEATPLIVDTTIYIGTIDGCLLAIGLASRDTLWEFWTEGQISAPPMLTSYGDDDAVVFGSYDNYMYTVRRKDGQLLSKFESGYYLNGAAAVLDGYICYGGCDQWLRVVDTRKGVQTDSLMLDMYLPASPVFIGNDAYIGDYGGNIYHLTIDKGLITSNEKIHRTRSADDASFIGLPAVGRDNVYFFSGGRSLTCVSRKDASVRWETMLKGPTGESSPLECRNGILVCTKSGIVTILDKDSGKVTWEYDTGEDILTCPAVSEGRFYIVTAKGTLLCFGS